MVLVVAPSNAPPTNPPNTGIVFPDFTTPVSPAFVNNMKPTA